MYIFLLWYLQIWYLRPDKQTHNGWVLFCYYIVCHYKSFSKRFCLSHHWINAMLYFVCRLSVVCGFRKSFFFYYFTTNNDALLSIFNWNHIKYFEFFRSSVRVIRSSRGGVGKTLYTSRMVDKLREQMQNIDRKRPISVVIRLHEKKIDINKMVEALLIETLPPECNEPRIFHVDISHEVNKLLLLIPLF